MKKHPSIAHVFAILFIETMAMSCKERHSSSASSAATDSGQHVCNPDALENIGTEHYSLAQKVCNVQASENDEDGASIFQDCIKRFKTENYTVNGVNKCLKLLPKFAYESDLYLNCIPTIKNRPVTQAHIDKCSKESSVAEDIVRCMGNL
ncbi:MAG: hypothetical protein AB7T49_14475 [Oligoflexales bacterium]